MAARPHPGLASACAGLRLLKQLSFYHASPSSDFIMCIRRPWAAGPWAQRSLALTSVRLLAANTRPAWPSQGLWFGGGAVQGLPSWPGRCPSWSHPCNGAQADVAGAGAIPATAPLLSLFLVAMNRLWKLVSHVQQPVGGRTGAGAGVWGLRPVPPCSVLPSASRPGPSQACFSPLGGQGGARVEKLPARGLPRGVQVGDMQPSRPRGPDPVSGRALSWLLGVPVPPRASPPFRGPGFCRLPLREGRRYAWATRQDCKWLDIPRSRVLPTLRPSVGAAAPPCVDRPRSHSAGSSLAQTRLNQAGREPMGSRAAGLGMAWP